MNCSYAVIYAQELRRMCAAHHACKGCPLRGDIYCLKATHIDPPHIKIVQEWSDTHSTYTINSKSETYYNKEAFEKPTEWSTTSNVESIQYSPLDLDSLKNEQEK